MSSAAESILSDLVEVEQERTRRRTDPSFGGRVCAIKSFQQMRFRQTYADWLNSARYRRAAVFFLEELYGPMDFSQRDAQFARIVPSLVRLFPADVVEVVRTLARLHALSESLDSAMAAHLDDAGTLDAQSYVRAWVATGRASERSAQVELTVSESAEGVRGDSANNVMKPATLETGKVVHVPLFIKEGEKVRISTSTGEYLGRA